MINVIAEIGINHGDDVNMPVEMDEEIKRWTACRKSALALNIIQGKTNLSESSRRFNLSIAEVESWMGQATAEMEKALQAKQEDIRGQYESGLKALQDVYGEATLERRVQKKAPSWRRTARGDSSYPAWLEGRRFCRSDNHILSLI